MLGIIASLLPIIVKVVANMFTIALKILQIILLSGLLLVIRKRTECVLGVPHLIDILRVLLLLVLIVNAIKELKSGNLLIIESKNNIRLEYD